MSMWKRKRYPFDVVLHLNGRHPYLRGHELDYPTRDVTVRVLARDWKHAEKEAMQSKPPEIPAWSWSVTSISRVRDATFAEFGLRSSLGRS